MSLEELPNMTGFRAYCLNVSGNLNCLVGV